MVDSGLQQAWVTVLNTAKDLNRDIWFLHEEGTKSQSSLSSTNRDSMTRNDGGCDTRRRWEEKRSVVAVFLDLKTLPPLETVRCGSVFRSKNTATLANNHTSDQAVHLCVRCNSARITRVKTINILRYI